jgi:hypothetical protein
MVKPEVAEGQEWKVGIIAYERIGIGVMNVSPEPAPMKGRDSLKLGDKIHCAGLGGWYLTEITSIDNARGSASAEIGDTDAMFMLQYDEKHDEWVSIGMINTKSLLKVEF